MRNRLLFASTALAAPSIVHMAAYENTLTRLIPDLFAAVDVVSRELVGFIPSAMRAPSAERAAVGQSVVYTIAPEMRAKDVVPAMQIPEPQNVNVANGFMTISKSRAVEFGFTGEEQRGLNTGPGYLSTQGGLIAQALRTLTNEIEGDLAVEAFTKASRAWGTAGTTPFETDLKDGAQVRKILDDNGAPMGRSLVLNTSAGANMRSLKDLARVNEAGTAMTLRQGELMDLYGMSIKESGASPTHVAGSGAAATTDAAGYAVGDTVITLAAAGTGAILPGDVITFAGDANKYVVAVGNVNVAAGGTITLAKPGLQRAVPAAATAVTLSATYEGNVAFAQSALHLVTRAPAAPVEGDLAIDRLTVTDPRSGLVFEVSMWPGYRKVAAEIAIAWGVHASKREHIALLLG